MFFTCSPKVSKPPSEQQEDWSRLIGVKWKLQKTSGNQRPRLWMERWMGHQSQLEARTKKGEEIQADRSMRIKRSLRKPRTTTPSPDQDKPVQSQWEKLAGKEKRRTNQNHQDGWSNDGWSNNGWSDDGWSDDGWTDDGWIDDGWNDDGWTDDGWTDDGWTDDGWNDDEWTDDGWTDDGWTDDGWTDDGWTDDGWSDDGWSDDGWSGDGNTMDDGRRTTNDQLPTQQHYTQRRDTYWKNPVTWIKQRTGCNSDLLTNGKFRKEKEIQLTKIKKRIFGWTNRFDGISKNKNHYLRGVPGN
ncbi:unnamed protein product [Caenorhabditis nigoni]